MKVNKMCSYRCFNVISDERAHSDGPFSVNLRPFDLILDHWKEEIKGFLMGHF